MKKMLYLTDIYSLINPNDEGEQDLKRTFRHFMEWYLRHRYMHYLLKEGKMQDKDAYIKFKDRFLLYFDRVNMEEENGPNENSN
jgi:hypothetical protein